MKKILFLLATTLVVLSSSAQRIHFGCALGRNVDIKETCAYIESLGYNCQGGSSGSIGEITIYSKVTVNDIQFKYCTLYFYNNTFWKIFYYNTLEEPKTIVSCLERKYDCESDSEDEFYYRNRDLEIQFDGKDLKYISLSVTTSILY